MTSPTPDASRSVHLTRVGPGAFRITNAAGGTLDVGVSDGDFSPVELLLAALAGCAAINVEELTGRRAEPSRFDVRAEGQKVRDESGGRMEDLRLVFDTVFPEGGGGDAARASLPRFLKQTHDRICTVSRTVGLGSDVSYELAEPEPGPAASGA
ncbi:OsmC family protein [Nocardioides sp.]|uniref:OsmC family protein n=1 Tax=Nocardioides sp. TaxID=35761 RepID=UPI002726D046|nr:OsmC family protein [Nocardioides sp.]MDO9454821.1 OsmC family protein [Nocardioides sp.]